MLRRPPYARTVPAVKLWKCSVYPQVRSLRTVGRIRICESVDPDMKGWIWMAVLATATAIVAFLSAPWSELLDDPRHPRLDPVPVWYSAPPAKCAPRPTAEHAQLFEEAAERAWHYFEKNTFERTGMAAATTDYACVTIWDVGSMLAAYHSAYGLGLIGREELDRRLGRVLLTLREMDLYDDAAFNKSYDARTGSMAGRDERPTTTGFGWSSTDLGRLLVWLRIIERHHPRFADDVRAIVSRLDAGRLVRDGYLRGEDLHPRTGERREYPEGRIGYEQYAAAGFALWGVEADQALDLSANAYPVQIVGQPVLGDERGGDRLLSDPLLMYEMEMGTKPDEWRTLICALKAAQEGRYQQTGQVTMVNEDAMPDPPYYFYYYSAYHDGKPWTVDGQGPMQGVDAPRWVSAKAALAWHATYPSAYTERAVEAVEPAAGPGGWASGVYEGSGAIARSVNVNTNAVILQAALYHRQEGRPLLEHFDAP